MIILVIGTSMYFLNNLSALDSERLIPENFVRKDDRRGMANLRAASQKARDMKMSGVMISQVSGSQYL